MQMLLVHYIP
uniref:Uncharacterized protein n=1 Tax=Anguilla anguilla TaxID=7936 RepID=A0A0E9PJA3_ANGAN